jgi:Dyp-type peroxidase family
MEARCSVLGDLRANHPRRWHLPLREGATTPVRVEMSQVHAVVQLRLCNLAVRGAPDDWRKLAAPLPQRIKTLGGLNGVRLLAVQTLWTQRDASRPQVVREHFGFVDGLSQPQPGANQASPGYDNTVPVGDLLLGYATDRDPAAGDALLADGSFLVVRKLRQHVHALRQALADALPNAGEHSLVKQLMMGRTLDGAPLAKVGAQAGDNDFDYQGDAAGRLCPYQAHVRRANPRTQPVAGRQVWRETPVPRIMRRGMSYGPPFNADEALEAHDEPERGVVFMAYNARIGEQFEQVQRWISGANSSGGPSSPGDPFLGVPKPGQPVTFRWIDEPTGSVRRVALKRKPDAAQRADWRPFVTLEWGLYLFTPSISTLQALQLLAAETAAAAPPPAWSAEEGERIIQDLLQRQARPGADGVALWKQALEDPTERRQHRSASVWAAIRAFHGGVLRTPFGVLVADADLVDQVFRDVQGHYSVKGYRERTSVAFGEIYLGLDRPAPGGDYDRQAAKTNDAIRRITRPSAFDAARRYALEIVASRVAETQAMAARFGLPEFELTLDLKEVSDHVLASLSEDWFGLQDGNELVRGGLDWAWEPGKPPPYPGHFTAPSRYVFQPQPGRVPMQMGPVHGQAVRTAVRRFGEGLRAAGQRPTCPVRQVPGAAGGRSGGGDAPVGAAVFDDPMATDMDWFARTFVGALVGFLPSVDGNFRATLNEWLSDGEFWRLRDDLLADPQGASLQAADTWVQPAMVRTMQLRAVPETVWRTAIKPHALGSGPHAVAVGADENVVVAIVSATQQRLAEGVADVLPVFGGSRQPGGLPAPGDPVHACPGYDAGMGALLGLYSALLGLPWQVRPAPAPLSLVITGPVPPPAKPG